MKTLTISMFLMLSGCASLLQNKHSYSSAPGAPPVCSGGPFSSSEFNKCRESQADAETRESVRKREIREKEARETAERESKVSVVGTSMEKYIEVFGQPDSKEIVNGADVLWYNSKEPVFVVFDKNKLVSRVIDRETLRDRERKRDVAEQRAQDESRRIQDNETERRRRAFLIMGQAFKPPQTTNCISRSNYAGGYTTSCTGN